MAAGYRTLVRDVLSVYQVIYLLLEFGLVLTVPLLMDAFVVKLAIADPGLNALMMVREKFICISRAILNIFKE